MVHPVTEAHLCQLAALENFAEHGVFVKFDVEEAVRLEARALDLAVQQSTQDAELVKCAPAPDCPVGAAAAGCMVALHSN